MSAPLISAIVPVYNKIGFLRQSLGSVVVAARRHGKTELIFVDHQSTDGSWEALGEYAPVAAIYRMKGGTISTVRNFGVRQARAGLLAFIDCDCVVPPSHFVEMERLFASTEAVAIGREYGIPENAHWTERTWYALHALERDGECRFINGGNLAVRREPFEAVGGFDDALVVAEDTDLCARLRHQGGSLLETHRLAVVHLGNPKSVPDFFRKQVWHGLGVLGGGWAMRRNRATVMIAAHALAICIAFVLLVAPGIGAGVRLTTVPALFFAIPVVTVFYRSLETRRLVDPLRAVALYVVFYLARVTALAKASRAALRPGSRRTAVQGAANI